MVRLRALRLHGLDPVHLFPDSNPLVSLIATYGVFAVGFVMRPLGSVAFGWMGDTFGRSYTLVLSVAMMALPTLFLGLLPINRYQQARNRPSPIVEAFTANRRETIQGVLFASSYGALFYLALVYLPTWISGMTAIPLDMAMRMNTITLALLIPLIPLAGWISDRYIRRTHMLAGAIVIVGIAGIVLLPWMYEGSATAALTGQIVMGLMLAVPLGVAGGCTPVLSSWLVLQTGSDLAPLAVLLTAAIAGVAGLLWMTDRSREPLMSTYVVSVRDAISGNRRAHERG